MATVVAGGVGHDAPPAPDRDGPAEDRARRDRTGFGAAIRGLADAPDLDAAAEVVASCAAWTLSADHAVVVRTEGGDPVVACSTGRGGPPPGQAMLPTGTLGAALTLGVAQESRRAGVAEVAAPIVVRGAVWGAVLVTGPASLVSPHPAERLSPFADLLSLAATTHATRCHLASLAGTDPLTGLANRRAFDDLLAAEVERARRHGDALSLVLLDIDHFKLVNDRHGHQSGDRVLAEVARRLVSIARRGEAVVRLGGEEFAWVLPRTGGDGALAAAGRAREAVGGRPVDGVGRVTVSAGVCTLGDVGGADELVRRADLMLYRAKADGRDTVRRWEPAREPVRG
ncbi:MAG: GGDEF domain-containing protein [Thermoleophilia bacterium]